MRVEIAGIAAQFRITSASEMERAMRFDGERRILARLLRETRLGDTVCDVGANLGFYSILLAKAVGPGGSVMAFEPERGVLARMQENAGLNGLPSIRFFDVALGETDATVSLAVDGQSGSGLHIMAGAEQEVRPGFATREVRQVRGDRFISDQGLPIPAIVKVDVEGMEREVLRGLEGVLTVPRCRLVLCEVHFGLLDRMGKSSAPVDIETLLRKSGFSRIEWLNRSHLLASKREI
ncbi:MAG: FkbM family methyltransferase [Candidatus Coatesbacteria bacterium]